MKPEMHLSDFSEGTLVECFRECICLAQDATDTA